MIKKNILFNSYFLNGILSGGIKFKWLPCSIFKQSNQNLKVVNESITATE